MATKGIPARYPVFFWGLLILVSVVPIVIAALSPLLAWRSPVYIAAGFSGIGAFVLLLWQPVLARGYAPGLSMLRARQIHRAIGAVLVLAVVVHVGGLWITSPPDVVDALTFNSPTSFSAWGMIAMWAIFATAVFALLRKPLAVRPRVWRIGHFILAATIVIGTSLHAILIEGTMEPFTKAILCLAVLGVSAKAWRETRL